MCGIFGASRITETTRRILPFLAYDLESRGTDSWGATNGYDTIKHIGPITGSWELPDDWSRGIFHTRAASIGAVTKANAHPFDADGYTGEGKEQKWVRYVIGVHNGCISSHGELNAKYKRKFEVDSMHIFAHIAEGQPLGEIRGWGAIAWYLYTPENDIGELRVARFNMEDLHVVRLTTGEVLFASTRRALDRACGIVGAKIQVELKIEADTEYRIGLEPGPDGPIDVVRKVGEMRFGYRYAGGTGFGENWEEYRPGCWRERAARAERHSAASRPAPRGQKSIHTIGEADFNANICMKSMCENKVQSRKNEVVCPSCMTSAIRETRRLIEEFRTSGRTA